MTDNISVEIHSPLLGITTGGNLRLATTGGKIPSATGIPSFGGPGIPSEIVMSNAKGTTNISDVTYQVSDIDGAAVAGNFAFFITLSDASTGLAVTTDLPDSQAAAGSGGVVLDTASVAPTLFVQTNANGAFVLAITDAGKGTYYPVAYWGGRSFVGGQLTSGSYG